MSQPPQAGAGAPIYRRIVLKLSGEALMGPQSFGIHEPVVAAIADEVREIHALGVEIAIVVGGGNIIRGLAATDHPFGAVVRPLGFHRQSLDAQVLVAPDAPTIPPDVIRNRALLETPDGTPFSFVVDTYTSSVLDEGP